MKSTARNMIGCHQIALVFKSRDEQKVEQIRRLLSATPTYEMEAKACFELGGKTAEMKFWLSLYDEIHDECFRSLLVPRRRP